MSKVGAQMAKSSKNTEIQVYDGYGHTKSLVIQGHVFKRTSKPGNRFSANVWHNTLDMIRLFFVKPFPHVLVKLSWQNLTLETQAGPDGFFRFEWSSEHEVEAGWHRVKVAAFLDKGAEMKSANGQLYVPHSTQYGFISDIDDTVMVSHSSRFRKRMIALFAKHAQSRKMFPDVGNHYKLLSEANTELSMPNPFFYVSSSEWNLYGYLKEFFRFNGFPRGVFLLNHIKRWYQFLKIGNTNHSGKLDRIIEILETFPKQQFVLLGDNSQADPTIYSGVVDLYADRIKAIFIRNVRPSAGKNTNIILEEIAQKGVKTFFYKNSLDAIAFSVKIGLLDAKVLTQNPQSSDEGGRK